MRAPSMHRRKRVGAVDTTLSRFRRLAYSGVTAEDGEWLAARLRHFLERAPIDHVSLDAVFELVPGPGGEPWWRTEARGFRDTAIRALAGVLCPGKPIAERARMYRRPGSTC